MIWHIFKKDLRLEWRLATLVALIQFASSAVLVKLVVSSTNPTLSVLTQFLVMATMAGIPFLIAAAVHQDAIPGVRQDWLVRPIQRRDLLLAKLLFVLAAVHGPMLLADLYRGLAFGFPFSASLEAALSRGLFVLIALSLPLLAFMSLTKNTMEAIAAGLIVFLAFAAGTLFVNQHGRGAPLSISGVSWVLEAAECAIALVFSIAVLGLQYFRRRTLVARIVAGAACVIATLALLFPWNPAFALQQRMSPMRGAASAITASFDPTLGPFRPYTTGEFTGNDERAIVFLPLRFENLPAGSALIVDHADVSRQTTFVGDSSSIALREQTGAERPAIHLVTIMPGDLFLQLKDQQGPLKIDLSLTLLRSQGLHSIPALNGSVHFADVGTCSTRVNNAETAVRVTCVPLDRSPSCYGLSLQHVPTGRINFPEFQCVGDYTPFADRMFLSRPPQWGLPFRDLSGLAKYPVDGSMLNAAQVVLEPYEAVDHFTRTIEVPSVRLADWTAKQQ